MSKIKIRMRIDRVEKGKLVLIPIEDEITITSSEKFEEVKNYAFVVEVKEDNLKIEKSWEPR